MNFLLADTAIISNGNGGDILRQLLFLVIVGVILGIIWYCVSIAPFLNDLFKKVLGYVIMLVGAIILINFLLSLVGKPLFNY
jgi:hypothetical protein